MSEWKAKRFWKTVAVTEHAEGFGIALDTRPVRTPAKAPLIVPTRALADAIAAEWDAVGEVIDPGAMPFTKSANAALDKVHHAQGAVIDMIAEYGATDLLCYRAASPAELVARQAAEWDPLLDWADSVLSARLVPVTGVMPQAQNPDALARLRTEVAAQDNFALTALHDLVGLSGSLVIGLAAQRSVQPIEELWKKSRLDELWQAELWGSDEEAERLAAVKTAAFLHAKRFFDLGRV